METIAPRAQEATPQRPPHARWQAHHGCASLPCLGAHECQLLLRLDETDAFECRAFPDPDLFSHTFWSALIIAFMKLPYMLVTRLLYIIEGALVGLSSAGKIDRLRFG